MLVYACEKITSGRKNVMLKMLNHLLCLIFVALLMHQNDTLRITSIRAKRVREIEFFKWFCRKNETVAHRLQTFQTASAPRGLISFVPMGL